MDGKEAKTGVVSWYFWAGIGLARPELVEVMVTG
jgi:hypothetical protein